jgi:hypothetical protein
MKKQTTIVFDNKTYPFYKTNRGQFDFRNAGYTPEQMADGNFNAMIVFIYFQLRDCARRAGYKFDYSLDDFIDKTDEDVLDVFSRLMEEPAPGEEKPKEELCSPSMSKSE